ncbi:MAG: helix-turn-helix domain-containing protein [Nitrospirae bacterium]|nr:helix-turn-helix domain-containing protein [Nitrospirota bacterium]
MSDSVAAWLTMAEFLACYPGKVSRNKIYECIKAGIVPHIKLGKILIPADALERILAANNALEAKDSL